MAWPKLELESLGGIYVKNGGKTYSLFGTKGLLLWPNFVRSLLKDIEYLEIGELHLAFDKEVYVRLD